jgi:NAD-dependent protein deacetylase/lipoamidase
VAGASSSGSAEARELGRRLTPAASVVVLTGAGMSAESGLPTFRSGTGALWNNHRPEDLATPKAFARDPTLVSTWYRERRVRAAAARPNQGHVALAEIAANLPSFTIVTQNVDGLHAQAGSAHVVELHGSIRWSRCIACGDRKPGSLEGPLPDICACGGLLRPAVVWFGEALPQAAWGRAEHAARAASVFIVAGTSAAVYPAAGLVHIAKRAGAIVAEVNPEPTEASAICDLVVRASVGEFFPAVLAVLREQS